MFVVVVIGQGEVQGSLQVSHRMAGTRRQGQHCHLPGSVFISMKLGIKPKPSDLGCKAKCKVEYPLPVWGQL